MIQSYGNVNADIVYYQDKYPSQAIIRSENQFVLYVVRDGPACLDKIVIEIINRVESFNQVWLEQNGSKERLMLRGIYYDNTKGIYLNLYFDYLFEDKKTVSEEEIKKHFGIQYGDENAFSNIDITYRRVFFTSDHYYEIHDDYYSDKIRKEILWKD